MMFPRLRKGDTVGIVAPASPVTSEGLGPAVRWLEMSGYRVRLGRSVGEKDRFLAGSDALRSEDLVEMFADDSVRAVFAARGGYGSSRLLDLVDWPTIRAHPKPFVGFSDTTALQTGLYTQCQMPSITGLALSSDASRGRPADPIPANLKQALRDWTFLPVEGLSHTSPVSGMLVGGCLSLLVHLLGTPYFPDLAGHLLVFEDVRESPYRIDRMLTQILLSGALKNAAGVLVGTFHDCVGDPEDGTVEEILLDFESRCPCPVIRGLMYGHGPLRRLLPVGTHAEVSGGILRFERSG